MQPLIEYMTPQDPEQRPTAAEAYERFKTIRSGLNKYQLAQRLRPLTPESTVTRIVKDAYYIVLDRWWSIKRKKKLPPLV